MLSRCFPLIPSLFTMFLHLPTNLTLANVGVCNYLIGEGAMGVDNAWDKPKTKHHGEVEVEVTRRCHPKMFLFQLEQKKLFTFLFVVDADAGDSQDFAIFLPFESGCCQLSLKAFIWDYDQRCRHQFFFSPALSKLFLNTFSKLFLPLFFASLLCQQKT